MNVLALWLFVAVRADAGALAKAVAVSVGSQSLTAGAPVSGAQPYLDCSESKVQHTIKRCTLKAASAPFARSLGLPISGATMNVHFQGEIVNLSVEFSGIGVDSLVSSLKARLPGSPRVEYWADDQHLFASYIWVDAETEVEATAVVKGPAGKTTMYVSSLAGNRPLNPEDAAD